MWQELPHPKNKDGLCTVRVLQPLLIDAIAFHMKTRAADSNRKHVCDRLWNHAVTAACYEGTNDNTEQLFSRAC